MCGIIVEKQELHKSPSKAKELDRTSAVSSCIVNLRISNNEPADGSDINCSDCGPSPCTIPLIKSRETTMKSLSGISKVESALYCYTCK